MRWIVLVLAGAVLVGGGTEMPDRAADERAITATVERSRSALATSDPARACEDLSAAFLRRLARWARARTCAAAMPNTPIPPVMARLFPPNVLDVRVGATGATVRLDPGRVSIRPQIIRMIREGGRWRVDEDGDAPGTTPFGQCLFDGAQQYTDGKWPDIWRQMTDDTVAEYIERFCSRVEREGLLDDHVSYADGYRVGRTVSREMCREGRIRLRAGAPGRSPLRACPSAVPHVA
jgi:hypothetical protein